MGKSKTRLKITVTPQMIDAAMKVLDRSGLLDVQSKSNEIVVKEMISAALLLAEAPKETG